MFSQISEYSIFIISQNDKTIYIYNYKIKYPWLKYFKYQESIVNEFQWSFTFLTLMHKTLGWITRELHWKEKGNRNILCCMNLSTYHAWCDEMTELLVAKTQEYRVMRRSYNKKGESGLVNIRHHLNFLSINDLLGSGTADGLQPYGSSSQWLFNLTGIEKQSAFQWEHCTMFFISH